MERYSERLVNGRVGADAFLMIGGGVILALGGVIMIIVLSSFGLFFIAGGIFIIVQATKRFRIEFEYLILNGDVDIAKIIAKSSRKNLYSIKAEDITYMASMQDDHAKNDLDIKRQLKVLDFTEKNPQKKESYYVIFENRNGKEAAIILDLDEKSLDIMKEALKQKFRK